MNTVVSWNGDFQFESQQGDHKLLMDANKPGASGAGPSPKGMLLSALGGCTGMDIVYILKNYGFEGFDFQMEIDADQAEGQPKIYSDIRVKYIFKGEGLNNYKIKRAVDLSATKYCAVSAMLKESSNITYEVYVNGDKVE